MQIYILEWSHTSFNSAICQAYPLGNFFYVVLIKNGVFMITSGITKASTQVTGVTQIESENELPHG